MSLSQSCSTEANVLRQSPAFSMSLGSKELFHTNFLAFLLESDDPTLQPMQRAIRAALDFSPGAGCVVHCAVWREKSNLDLIVVELQPAGSNSADCDHDEAADRVDTTEQVVAAGGWDWDKEDGWQQVASQPRSAARNKTNNSAPVSPYLIPSGRVMVIEAKLKSIPRVEQLEAYDDLIAKSGVNLSYPEATAHLWKLKIQHQPIERRLLTIGGKTMGNRAHNAWLGVSWSQVQAALAISLTAITGSPLEAALTDYVDMLGALVEMARQATQLCDDAHRVPVPYGAVLGQVLDSPIKALRLRDLLGKTLFDHWLQSHILPKLARHLCHPIPKGWELDSYTHYTRDTPGLGVELINKAFASTTSKGPSDLRLGVQVQGTEFRLLVSVDRPYVGLETWIAGHPRLLPQWHQLPVFNGQTPTGVRNRPILPPTVKGRSTNLKKFDLSRFLYSKHDIENYTVDEVVNEIVRVMAQAVPLLSHL